MRVLTDLLDEACSQGGLDRSGGPVAEVAELLLAGVDLPVEEETFGKLMRRRGWARRTIVGNDTFAVLRAGTERGWGVAVVCGAGINCVGLAPDGRQARFAALGSITGDWGGGFDVGLAALSAAARSEDGRGPATALEQAVPAHFDLSTPLELAEALHLKQIPHAPPHGALARRPRGGRPRPRVGRRSSTVSPTRWSRSRGSRWPGSS